MLKVEYGMIGNNGFVNISLEDGDFSTIKMLVDDSMENFYSTNGCALSLVDILDGKKCVPCENEEIFKMIEFAVNEFNEKYISAKKEEEQPNKTKELSKEEFKKLLNKIFLTELSDRSIYNHEDNVEKNMEYENTLLKEHVNELLSENNELKQDLFKMMLENKILKFLLSSMSK